MTDENPPPISPIQRPNWFSRNWKWAPPGGCLIVLLVGVAFVAAAFFLALGMMKQSDAYKIAVDRAQQNQAGHRRPRFPINAGNFISGSSHVEGPSGDAKLSIPISGPKGKGTLYVEATKSAGVWQFAILVVKIEKTGERINLNQPPRPR